jgi:hypothetical protein
LLAESLAEICCRKKEMARQNDLAENEAKPNKFFKTLRGNAKIVDKHPARALHILWWVQRQQHWSEDGT